MQLFINKLLSGIITTLVILLVLFVVWLLSAKKKVSFRQWLGIKTFTNKDNIFLLIVLSTLAFALLGAYLLYLFKDIETAITVFSGKSISALPAILVYATLGTAIPEELIFRAFIMKRMQKKFSFLSANIVQAVFFGSVHGLAFITLIGSLKAILLFMFTMAIALVMAYINEQKADGSILPSIIIHASANIFAGIISAWSLIA